ncbi:hypothetical protein D3C86_2094590 [compost metagenome]
MVHAVLAGCFGKAGAGQGRADVRHRQFAGKGCDVAQQCRLEVALDLGLGGIDDLQDIGGAVGGLDLEVLVAFAGQQRQRAGKAVMLLQQC